MPVNKIQYMDKREVMPPHWHKNIMETFKDTQQAVVHRFTPYVSIVHGELELKDIACLIYDSWKLEGQYHWKISASRPRKENVTQISHMF
jgi:hypothetical protein